MGKIIKNTDTTILEEVREHWIALVVGAGVFLVIAGSIIFLRGNSSVINNPTPTTETTAYPTTDPALIASSLSFNRYDSAVDVTIDTGIDSVSGVQLKIAYDPKVLTNVKVVPGSFFPNGTVLQNDVDITKGIISYAFAINPGMQGQKGKGQVVTITYTAVPQTATDMVFLSDTKVTSQGVNTSVLNKTATVTVP